MGLSVLGLSRINISLDAQSEKAGQDVIFVIDQESQKIQEKNKKLLKGILKQLEKINS